MAAILEAPALHTRSTIALSLKDHSSLPSLPSAETDTISHWRSIECNPRHKDCILSALSQLDANDVTATPYIICSRGASRNPKHFYCTAYATTHNTKYFKKADGGVRTTRTPSHLQKPRTGYSINVLPYVEYDKSVDEGPEFDIKEPFGTSHKHHYKAPTTVSPQSGEISTLIDSGFTRMPPKYNVTTDGTTRRDMTSTMKSSYDSSRLSYKGPHFDKDKVTPSGSAYLSNSGQIQELGTDNDVGRFERPNRNPPTERDWRNYNTSHMVDDGYTRSHHANILGRDDPADIFSAKDQERIRKTDPTRWVQMQDPNTSMSTSRMVHRPFHPLYETMTALKLPGTKVGNKEPQGSVRNNPVYLNGVDIDPRQRFSTETGDRYTYSMPRFTPGTFPKIDGVAKSTGFTRGNKFEYTFDVPNDAESQAQLHPMQACARRQADRGTFSVKPTQVKFGEAVGNECDCGCNC
ncbi:hypothetical protein SpCBS45565_g02420 [Spizellomyces sp. 'palustris']|nr:hypothetical protein SpCBS45565_g02420 [Spizellomyces sp. 'palustris']